MMFEIISMENWRFPRYLGYSTVAVNTFLTYLIFCSDRSTSLLSVNIFYYFTMLLLVTGLPFGVSFILAHNRDVSTGVFMSYLSLPISPLKVIVSKYMVYFFRFLVSLILPFVLLYPLGVEFSTFLFYGIILVLLYLLYFSTVVIFISISFKGEVSTLIFVLYFVILFLFSQIFPKPYIYILYPFEYFSKCLMGGQIAEGAALYSYLSLLLYAGILFISVVFIRKREWGVYL